MDDILAKMFEGVGEVMTPETKTTVANMINDLVETRVKATLAETEEKLKSLEAEKAQMISEMDAKEEILKESATEFARKLAKEFSEKEQIIFESLQEYKKVTEDSVKEAAHEYKSAFEKVIFEETKNYREFVEQTALEEAANFRKEQEVALAKQVGTFKEDMLTRLDEYVGIQLEKAIPKTIMEAAVEAAAYRPIVEGVLGVVGANHIKLDASGKDALLKAKTDNEKLTEAVNAKAKDNMKLESRVRELEKLVKLNVLTEGMTQGQKAKANKLLEGYRAEELESKFNAIKDIIINESVKPAKSTTVADTVVSDSTKKQLERLTESHDPNLSAEMKEYAHRLDKARRA
jgi:hypothetical protein